MADALLKVGGSLYRQPLALRAALVSWVTLAHSYRLLLIPGGGPFADTVRAADAAFGLGDSTAHWMAIAAMDQYGALLADQAAGTALVDTLAAAGEAMDAGQLAILAPSALLRAADPLPHSWQVTSDSLAAWIAGQAGARLLVLLKDVPGLVAGDPHAPDAKPLPAVARGELSGYAAVDAYFATALPPGMPCWVVDGRQPELLRTLLERGSTAGTRVS